MSDQTSPFKSGFIAIAGKPNVGKSTLTNVLLGQPIAGVSAKPQTTRKRQLAIAADDAVARNEKHQQIVRQGSTHCAGSLGLADLSCNLRIGTHFAPGD